jgi:hypothetical protein
LMAPPLAIRHRTTRGAACARARALSPRPDGHQHLGRQRSPIFRATHPVCLSRFRPAELHLRPNPIEPGLPSRQRRSG